MAKLKGAIVERFEHPITKRKGVIRLDRSRMLFFASEDEMNPPGTVDQLDDRAERLSRDTRSLA